MKKIGLMSFVLIAAFAISLSAQPPAGQGGGGGRGGGGRGGGAGRGAPAAAAPAPLQAFADTLAAAVNKQDAAALTKMLAMDALYLDEDGHAIPATVWAMRITTGAAGAPAKVFAISGSHGQMIDDNTAWLSFNYTLAETFQGAPKTLTGTASMVLKKASADWSILMVHGALKQNVAGLTQ